MALNLQDILDETKKAEKEQGIGFCSKIKNFSFLEFCKINTPKYESMYVLFGLFSMISIFSAMHTIPHTHHTDSSTLTIVHYSALLIASVFVVYPVLPSFFHNNNFISVFWNLSVTYILVFASSLVVIESGFGELQSMILMLNLVIVAILMRWQAAMSIMIVGIFSSIIAYKFFDSQTAINIWSLQFKIVYLLLLFSSILIVFFKPKHEHEEVIEQKVMERTFELEEALAARTEFLNNISHEIRTPMHGFVALSSSLVEHWQRLDNEEKLELAEHVSSSAERLSRLVGNLLDMSKFTSGQVTLHLEHIDFVSLINNMIDESKALYLNGKHITFQYHGPTALELLLDSERISQVLRNLFVNAIKFGGNGTIYINVELLHDEHKPYLKCSISDEGIGIPEKELISIFESFVQSSRTKTKKGGTGLGLSICKSIITAHRGKIWASHNNDKGATISFIIPSTQ